jgi:hypothetical protein
MSKMIITVETVKKIKITNRPVIGFAYCAFCHAESIMLRPDTAARSADISERELFRQIESGKLHFLEIDDKRLLICGTSLCKSSTERISNQNQLVKGEN